MTQTFSANRGVKPSYLFVLPWDLSQDGGVNQVVLNLHREMLEAGEYEPIILTSKWSSFRPEERLVDGRKTIFMRLWPPYADGKVVMSFLRCILAFPVWMLDLLRLCRRHRVAAINFHFPGIAMFPVALAKRLGLYRGALIVSFHGADLQNTVGANRVERFWWRFDLDAADAIVACSKAFSIDVRAFAGKAAHKVVAIHNGLDIEHLKNKQARGTSLPAALMEREFILSIATWERKKGLDVLLRAFAELRKDTKGLAMVLAGRPSEEEARLKKVVHELGIGDDVLFIESLPHNQIGMYLERAKVFCLPSRAEPFGIVILEAGAYRCPVVASRVGGIPEIIEDGQSGVLVEVGNAEALALALRKVLADSDVAGGLGNKLFESVSTHFTWRRAYETYRNLIRDSRQTDG